MKLWHDIVRYVLTFLGDGKALQSRRWFTLRVVAGVILVARKNEHPQALNSKNSNWKKRRYTSSSRFRAGGGSFRGKKKRSTSQRKNVRSGGESGLHKVAGSGYDSSCNPTVEKTLADCWSRSKSRLGSSVLVEFLSPKRDLQVRFIGIWWFGSLLEGTAFHIPNFVLLCYIHSRYLLTFIPPIWPSAVKFFTNYIRQSFISESWLNSGKYWGWTYPVPGSKASICLLYQLLQYGCWNSTQYRCYAVRSSKQPESLLAFWPFCCRISGWRECWAQTQRLGNSKHFLSDCLPILLETALFGRKIQSFIIGHWSMYHTAMEQASLVTQCAVAWQNQLRGASWPFLLEFLLEQHCLWSFDCVIRKAIKNALCS